MAVRRCFGYVGGPAKYQYRVEVCLVFEGHDTIATLGRWDYNVRDYGSPGSVFVAPLSQLAVPGDGVGVGGAEHGILPYLHPPMGFLLFSQRIRVALGGFQPGFAQMMVKELGPLDIQ